MENLIIIGSGPAGLTAAIYASRANVNPLLFEGDLPGGQLTTTTEIENFPGFPKGILGSELMAQMKEQAKRFGAKIESKIVDKVDFSNGLKVFSGGKEYMAKSVIISTGAKARMLGLPREDEFLARGLHTCATCDGFFYKDKTVAVIGGGDSALEESLFLANLAKKVFIIHRRDEFRASKIMQKRVFENPKIEVVWNTEVSEYLGEKMLSGLKLHKGPPFMKKLAVDEPHKGRSFMGELAVDGVFLAVGHIPNTDIFKGQIELFENGYVKTKDFVKTNIEGVFTAGDCADFVYRQAITSAGSGCAAAMEAEKFLTSF